MEVLELNRAEIRALKSLIDFHEDWDELSEIVSADVHNLYHKLSEIMTY